MSQVQLCCDMILPDELDRLPALDPTHDASRAILVLAKRWTVGTTIGVGFLGGTDSEHRQVESWASEWTQHANLKLDFQAGDDADIRIAFVQNNRSWSYVGTDCLGIEPDQPTMNFGWTLRRDTVLHEFGHALGLDHEHQNPAGGIEWKEDAVLRDLAGPPNNWDDDTIRRNVLRKYERNQINGTEFDPQSIMLYAFPGTWTVSGQPTRANSVLSEKDKQFIGSNFAYPFATESAVELPVVDTSPVEARIGQPGEEDRYEFTVATAGKFVVETLGPTDLVMKLFGPDAATHLLAEDDDGGRDQNARIVRELQPGKYFVQVRHYNRTEGAGEYAIRVTRV